MYSNILKKAYKTMTNPYGMNKVHLDDEKTGISNMSEIAPFIKDFNDLLTSGQQICIIIR